MMFPFSDSGLQPLFCNSMLAESSVSQLMNTRTPFASLYTLYGAILAAHACAVIWSVIAAPMSGPVGSMNNARKMTRCCMMG